MTRMQFYSSIFLLFALIAIGAGWVGAAIERNALPASTLPRNTARDLDNTFQQRSSLFQNDELGLLSAIQSGSKSTVAVVGRTPQERNVGSGFFIDTQGSVVTSAHVVDNPLAVYTIVTKTGKSFPVTHIIRSDSSDLALLQTNARGYRALSLEKEKDIPAGQQVAAIGYAFGSIEQSVTVGIISGLDRIVETNYKQVGTEKNAIQIDAAINPGNSGGPLLDPTGKVVGVNFAYRKEAQNIAFAIPGWKVNEFIQQSRQKPELNRRDVQQQPRTSNLFRQIQALENL